MQQSNNPFFKNKEFNGQHQQQTTYYNPDSTRANVIDYNDTMTVTGTVNKTFIMFALVLVGAATAWYMPHMGLNPVVPIFTGLIVALIAMLVASFSPKTSPYSAPVYALFEGVFIGGISLFFNQMWPGIVLQAVTGTFATFGLCLALYRFGIVKVTQQFRSVVMVSIGAVALLYMFSFMMSLFGVSMFIYGTSIYSIGFSIVVIVIFAMRLFLDFDDIEEGARRSLPKYMEWFGALGVTITLVLLYLEVLKLLAKLNSRD
jgi:uncharacterized YccA/Bax inhibitor family protein